MNRDARRMIRAREGGRKQDRPAVPRAEPTPERMRRAGTDFARGTNGQITMRDSPLERAFARNLLSREQYSAGQKYRHHWYRAGLAGRLGSCDLDGIFKSDPASSSGMAKTESEFFHRQRYRDATQAIGKIGSHVLEWAVCREIALERVGYSLGWGSRAQAYAAAAERLKTALDQLCGLWGIEA